MILEIQGKTVETSEQGFLINPDDRNEDVARVLEERDGIELFVNHWELIWYFRDYFATNQYNPSMHDIVPPPDT